MLLFTGIKIFKSVISRFHAGIYKMSLVYSVDSVTCKAQLSPSPAFYIIIVFYFTTTDKTKRVEPGFHLTIKTFIIADCFSSKRARL